MPIWLWCRYTFLYSFYHKYLPNVPQKVNSVGSYLSQLTGVCFQTFCRCENLR